jgi:uncharacterized membrane protein (UPF0136 family)
MSSASASISSISRPTGSSHLTFTVAALTAAGGVMGYAKKKSTRSLAAGLIFGASFAFAGHLINSGEAERGFKAATLASAALALPMGFRAIKFRQPFPSGALAGIGVASGVYHGMKWQEFAEDS